MSKHQGVQLRVEQLERRDCPAPLAPVVVQTSSGNLLVRGNSATTNLTVLQTGTNSFRISEDGSSFSQNVSGITGKVHIKLSNENDTGVTVNLQNRTVADDVFIELGNGTNDLTVRNGSVQKKLTVFGGIGKDWVNLGDGRDPLTVNGKTRVQLGDNGQDSLTAKNAVLLKQDLETKSVENVTLDAESRVNGGVDVWGGRTGNTLELNGDIRRDVIFNGSKRKDVVDTVVVDGDVAGNVTLRMNDSGTPVDGGNDVVRIRGNIGNNLFVHAGAGNDTVDISGSVNNGVDIRLGGGNDVFKLSGRIGPQIPGGSGRLTLDTGLGNDFVFFDSTAVVVPTTITPSPNTPKVNSIFLGGGIDTVRLSEGTIFHNAVINGGFGLDSLFGFENLGANIELVSISLAAIL